MRALRLWDDYTREEVHGIFSPNTRFTPQARTWGLQGIVRVPARQGDWVFFVTFGKSLSGLRLPAQYAVRRDRLVEDVLALFPTAPVAPAT
jgi:hypothetical protein